MDIQKDDIDYGDKYRKYKTKYNNRKLELLYESEYPYYKLFYELDMNKFKELVKQILNSDISVLSEDIPNTLRERIDKKNKSKHKIRLNKYDNKYFLIEEDWDGTEELNNITDYFTEECRVLCRFGDNPSPLDYWKDNKNDILSSNPKINIKDIRDDIYNKTKLCSNFRISVSLKVLKAFKAKKWLDISAGWGDRLISAIAYNVDRYVAVDPNDCLHPKYKKIIDSLVPIGERDRYTIIKDGFEKVELPIEKFDLVFSSPPFFELEIYSQSESDSLVSYNTIDEWYNNFLIKSLNKAYEHLEKDGHMILYMDLKDRTYLNKMIEHLSNIMEYKGIIYFYYNTTLRFRKMFVWKKY